MIKQWAIAFAQQHVACYAFYSVLMNKISPLISWWGFMQFRTISHFFATVIALAAFAGCGKQGPKESPAEKATRRVNEVLAYYSEEIAVIASEKDDKMLKKKIGAIIREKPVKRKKIDTFDWFIGAGHLTGDKIPFHRYQEIVEANIKRMREAEEVLVKNNELILAQKARDTVGDLLIIKNAAIMHKEYKNEVRYLELAKLRSEKFVIYC
jgi:predicted small lipoprotein YifL